MKRLMVFLVIGMVLFALYGCSVGGDSPLLTVAISPPSGHPPFTMVINAACSVSDGTYTLDVPGHTPVLSTDGSFTAMVNTAPWRATLSWTDGNTVVNKPIVARIENKRPVAHDLSFTPAPLFIGQGEIIDLRYREAGCKNGTALRYFGIEDPDYTVNGYSAENDHFTYHVDVYDDITGARETVFKQDRTFLDADEFTASPKFKWFVGWSGLIPPFQFSPMVCGPDPIQQPISGGSDQVIAKRIEVTVKEFGNTYRWVYHVTNKGG